METLYSSDLMFDPIAYKKVKDTIYSYNLSNKVQIVGVTKYLTPLQTKKYILESGILDLGENRVEDLIAKYEALHDIGARFHFIGHLQSNKAKKALPLIDVLHSLDSLRLASLIQEYRKEPLDCYIEVKLTDNPNKSGIKFEEISYFLNQIKDYDKIHIVGFMGMADLNEIEKTKESFKKLDEYRNEYYPNYKLSMGMSSDYQIALQNHTNCLRLGRILLRSDQNGTIQKNKIRK